MDTLLVAKAVMPQSAGSAGDAVAGASDAGTADAGSQFGQLLSTQLKAMHAADAGVSVGQSVAAIVSDDSRQSADSANAALLSALTAQLSGEASDAAQIATQPSDKPQSTEVAQLPDASLAVDAANLVGAPSVPTDAVRPSAGDVASQAVRRSRHDATSDTAEQAVRPAVEPSADTLSATNAKKQQAALSDAAQSAVPSQADAESPGAGASLELLLASTIARPRGSPEQSAANGGKKLPGADKSGAEDAKKTVADTSEVKDAPAVDAQAMAQAAAAMQAASVPVKSEPVAGAFKGDAPAAQSSAGLPGAVADRLRAIPAETSLAQAAESAKPES
ncbi:MAG TPA: hypothetical protein VFW53_06545, partial [Gallionella sp.]|nr:hypothetical protein [Gallionella sp.]